ncbi:MAG: phosphoenolpyruvate carboxylase [Bacteroidetes bacterium]|nr:phosphoenolpyruvate carboxylase [Bacteroidota bacterium]
MSHAHAAGLQQFKNQVGLKFQLYNSLFTALPFHRIERTGILLSLLLTNCEDGFRKNMSPTEILEDFFKRHTGFHSEQEQLDLLFRFVQYAERQIVLFDALEDASFREVNDMQGIGTIKQLINDAVGSAKQKELIDKLSDYEIRLVLTAHPTQFYPGSVLGIINDLAKALAENNTAQINTYLQQLGKTPFLKRQKPTPFDEAVSLIWYLENVFYAAAGKIFASIKNALDLDPLNTPPMIRMGFWPGGDRDGNPFVTTETTLKVAAALRGSIIKCYYLDVRKLKRRLTFKGVDHLLAALEQKLYDNIFIPGYTTSLTQEEILNALQEIRNILIYQHNGLFVQQVESLIGRVQLFGLHFASLDVRQDSSMHHKVLQTLKNKEEKLNFELLPDFKVNDALIAEESIVKDTLETMKAIRSIQQMNGEAGCHRYIISQCQSADQVLEVMQLFHISGWEPSELNIDIVPLFETIDDLTHAGDIMRQLYEHPLYATHLKRRKKKQTIMLGFSDGTKDGGYLMANWSIYKAKEALTQLSRQYEVDVIFFDGRGGPPARGGGKTHKFYASMGKNISNKEIQLTVQGQTVSSNFGTTDAAQYNMEQLLSAGISNDLFTGGRKEFSEAEEMLIQELSEKSYESYIALKEHPYFMQYLVETSPLRFYSDTNIASRPTKRGTSTRLELKDLRAIPYVGAWSQLKQNVTGYYGLGTALQQMDAAGKFSMVQDLYRQSLFIKTLIDNCEMAMKKCYFPLTAYMADHPVYGVIWNMIFEEYELTKKYILKLSGKKELMEDYPVDALSVQMRERIVLPLITIQQFALAQYRAMQESRKKNELLPVYEKLIIRSSFGIINAARNSA